MRKYSCTKCEKGADILFDVAIAYERTVMPKLSNTCQVIGEGPPDPIEIMRVQQGMQSVCRACAYRLAEELKHKPDQFTMNVSWSVDEEQRKVRVLSPEDSYPG